MQAVSGGLRPAALLSHLACMQRTSQPKVKRHRHHGGLPSVHLSTPKTHPPEKWTSSSAVAQNSGSSSLAHICNYISASLSVVAKVASPMWVFVRSPGFEPQCRPKPASLKMPDHHWRMMKKALSVQPDILFWHFATPPPSPPPWLRASGTCNHLLPIKLSL